MTSGLTRRKYKRDHDRSHNDHDEEEPAPGPRPRSGRQEQAQDEEEERRPQFQEQAAAVDGFRLPYLIAIGRHVFYLLSKMGTANRSIGGRSGESVPAIFLCDPTLTVTLTSCTQVGNSPLDRDEMLQTRHVSPGAFQGNLSTASLPACPRAFMNSVRLVTLGWLNPDHRIEVPPCP